MMGLTSEEETTGTQHRTGVAAGTRSAEQSSETRYRNNGTSLRSEARAQGKAAAEEQRPPLTALSGRPHQSGAFRAEGLKNSIARA